ncbi:hypothetical protein GTO10_03960, partial [Candidatus Saccharibacteria bacterium]|nr:hypothetical protein [Candidatus Saccharibacteria bacterium]
MRKYVRMGLAVGGWISVYLVFFRSIFFAPMIALLGAEIGIIVSFIAIYFWCMSFYLILHRDNGRSLHQNIAKLLAVAEGSFLSRMARRLAKRDSLGLLNAMKTQLDKYVLAGIL